MKYIVDIDSNPGFIQIIGTSELGDRAVSPFVFQIRGASSMLMRLREAIAECLLRIKHLEARLHESHEAHDEFHYGFVTFHPGHIPITLMTHAGQTTLTIGHQQVGCGVIHDLYALQRAIQRTLSASEREEACNDWQPATIIAA